MMTSITSVKPYPLSFKQLLFRIFVTALILLWILGFALLPLFHDTQMIVLFPFLKKIYSEFCHQLDYKTLNIFGYNLLVCSRCTGIYIGAFVISFVFIFLKNKIELNKKLFYSVSLILLTDVVLSTFGVYDYSKSIAFITGLFFGSVSFAYILTLIDNFLFN